MSASDEPRPCQCFACVDDRAKAIRRGVEPREIARMAWREQIEEGSAEQDAWYALTPEARAALLIEQEVLAAVLAEVARQEKEGDFPLGLRWSYEEFIVDAAHDIREALQLKAGGAS
jgi:hypothetical protein